MWFIVGPRNRIADRVFIRRMLEYSARKNSANGPPAYSTLNPDTSSDSPSVRSNGARFVSARVEMNHIVAIGHAGTTNQIGSCEALKFVSIKPPVIRIRHSRISPSVTSYEMVCATARSAPTKAYFEFDDQPEPRIEYTAKLDMDRRKRMPRFRFDSVKGIGRGIQIISARVSAIIGIIRNRVCDDVDGRTGSLINNFSPSAIG